MHNIQMKKNPKKTTIKILNNRMFKDSSKHDASDFVRTKLPDFGGIETAFSVFRFIEAI